MVGLLTALLVATGVDNVQVCSGFVQIIAASVGELIMLLYIFSAYLLPLTVLLAGVAGIIGFAVNLRRPALFGFVATLATIGGVLLARLPTRLICGGGPWP
ncbi:MAG TPA: hypothetical protein VGF18_00260 [Candidatus Tumulicola sp.]